MVYNNPKRDKTQRTFPNGNTEIRFGTDQVFNLNRDEFQNYVDASKGEKIAANDNVKNLIAAEKEHARLGLIEQNLAAENLKREETNKVYNEAGFVPVSASDAAAESAARTDTQRKANNIPSEIPQVQEQETFPAVPLPTDEEIQQVERDLKVKRNVSFIEANIKNMAELFDAVPSFISGVAGRPSRVLGGIMKGTGETSSGALQKATATTTADLDWQIEQITKGRPLSESKSSFELAITAYNQMEKEIKQRGQKDPVWFNNEGRYLAVQVLHMKTTLADKRAEAFNAENIRRQGLIRASFGRTP